DLELIEENHSDNICDNISAEKGHMDIIENNGLFIENHQAAVQGSFEKDYLLDIENYQIATQDSFGSFEKNYLLNIKDCPDTTDQYIPTTSTEEITIK
ncbi:9168_t:CDS:1, partial [Racocetra persica]